uniref:hypothetical protein n=1 Tax=Flavobacterium sp. TaxID=239 RepID=UPI00404B4313
MNELVKKYNSDDIERQFINNDIISWKEEVSSINVEIEFFKKILTNKTKNIDSESVFCKILKQLETKDKENKRLYNNLIHYIRKTSGINECEDLDCETYYINDHINFKLNIESFLYKYKRLKRMTYLKLMSSIN